MANRAASNGVFVIFVSPRLGERNLSGKIVLCKRWIGNLKNKILITQDTDVYRGWVFCCLVHRSPTVGRISSVSTVAFGGSRIALTAAVAIVAGDTIFFRGACGQNEFQMSVSVAPGIRAITRMPLGRSSSRNVLVKPRAPCFEAT